MVRATHHHIFLEAIERVSQQNTELRSYTTVLGYTLGYTGTALIFVGFILGTFHPFPLEISTQITASLLLVVSGVLTLLLAIGDSKQTKIQETLWEATKRKFGETASLKIIISIIKFLFKWLPRMLLRRRPQDDSYATTGD